ncbi:monosaccharide-transporting ATPase [Candidatus Vecturithrix granuli]|uniref:Monosaccharide-transporting ATPase n=1 Tax=Vecturithrix granuli TaxID=1499967 RepID=A0A081C920_VECG1|nr:monosaccharide-transporting ATPase [Candidatus Vecturithrix granuli]
MKKLLVVSLAGLLLLSLCTSVLAADKIKIGFLVKQPDEPWFQDEWKYAQQAADELGFELIKIGATDGEKVLAGIDNLAAQQAQGFVICTPDVKLGPAIVAKAQAAGLKVMSVDDRFVGPDGNPMEEVHHMGISAFNIGKAVGQALVDEAAARGWDLKEVGFLRMSYDQLPTIKERTDGATEVLVGAGLPEANIFDSPMKVLDIEASMNAANITLTKHPDVKLWVVAGGNDSSAIGAVRALEGQKVPLENAIAVGINGTEAVAEFEKPEPTALIGSILLAAKQHGYGTAENMFKWIKDGVEPEKAIWTAGQLITRENYKEVMGLN